MADDQAVIASVTANLEATYQALRSASTSIAGLLAVGRATCDEVAAYNVWALAVYNSQRGMLDALRNAGESGVPVLPTYPTLFAWNGVSGEDALTINCAANPSNLSGAKLMKRALRGPGENPTYVGLDQVKVITTGQGAYNTQASQRTLAELGTDQLGNPIVLLIVIAAVSIGIVYGLSALADYLKESKIQVETTERTRVQSEAFSNYAAARLDCYNRSIAAGTQPDDAANTCAKLITPPVINIDSARGATTSTLTWIGFAAVVGVGALVAYKVRERHQAGTWPFNHHAEPAA